MYIGQSDKAARQRGVASSNTIPLTMLDDSISPSVEQHLLALLRTEGIDRRAVYRPGEVCRLLRISPTTLRQLCELAEHPDSQFDEPRALKSFLIGSHHRIAHTALAEWLSRNQRFHRQS